MYRHYRQLLDGPRQQFYDWLYSGLAAGIPYLDSSRWPIEEIHSAIRSILLDNPSVCHFEGCWEYRQGIIPHYTMPSSSVQALINKAQQIRLSGEIPPAAYDYLLKNTVYDISAPHSQSAWGAMMDGKAVCKGIAKAYQLLLHLHNIPCILVEGSLDGILNHVWNLVWDGSRWYHVDVTMGYPQFRHLVGGTESRCGYDFAFSTAVHTIYHPELLPINSEGGIYHA